MTTVREWLRNPRLLPESRHLGWTPYAWLLWLSSWYIHPVVLGASVAGWTLLAAGTVVFLASYFRGYWVRDHGLVPVVLIQIALGLAFTPFNTGSYVLFVYAASFAARMPRRADALRWVGAIFVIGVIAAWVTDAPLYYWCGHVVFTPFIAGVNYHDAGVERSNATLRLAQQEIAHLATVAERERISRDLHDVLGHTLSLIVLKAELASKLAERDPARAIQEIRDVEQVSRSALKDVRESIRGYRPTLADEITRARALLEAARISAEVDIGAMTLPREQDEVIALALREAVTNVVRHSGASHTQIRVWREDECAMLEVKDDGRHGTSNEGAGLRGMRERVESLGGQVSRAFERGMRLTVSVPLAGAGF